MPTFVEADGTPYDPGRPRGNRAFQLNERAEIRRQTIRELKKLVRGCVDFTDFKRAVRQWDPDVDLPDTPDPVV